MDQCQEEDGNDSSVSKQLDGEKRVRSVESLVQSECNDGNTAYSQESDTMG